MIASFLPLESDISIGEHVVRKIGGISFNLDTIWTTAIAGGLVLLLGFIARRALTKDTHDHVPTKVQLIWEAVVGGMVVGYLVDQAAGTMPAFTLAGLALGMVGGAWAFWLRVRSALRDPDSS
jgi:F-type H+-transporting ATPase subunit a